jgi:hypothetical protein
LLASVNRKNASVAEAMDQVAKMQKAKDLAEKTANDRANTAVASAESAVADYDKQKKSFADDRVAMEEQKTQLTSKLTADAAKAKTEIQRAIDEKELFVKHNQQLAQVNELYRERQEGIKKGLVDFKENPDGHITRVSQNQRLVWIDLGRGSGLMRQTTFSVYEHNENDFTSPKKAKGRIEVLSVGDGISEARILDDKPSNPIVPGDIVETPAWAPGQRIHFAMAMKMDINKDRVDDYDMVKSIIKMNGGEIDAELRVDSNGKIVRNGEIGVDTRYFVEGERPSEATNPDVLKQYVAFDQDRARFGVKKISVSDLLALMGWRAEERSVELSGSRGAFMRRSPGKAQPTTTSETPTSESGTTPATAPAPVDPFGTPAPTTPAPPDPFGAPAPNPAGGADADPFAAPR